MKENDDTKQALPFKDKINKTTIHPGVWIEQWKNDRGYVLAYSKYKTKKSKTCILFVHGGGFNKNQPRDPEYNALCYYLTHGTGYDTYCPDYTLAPNKRYPSQIVEILSIAEELSKTYKHIIIGGDSAGGTIALQTALVKPELFYSGFLLSAWIDLDGKYTHSYYTRAWNQRVKSGDPVFKEAPKKNIKDSKEEALNYLGEKELLDNPLANPILATTEMLAKLPPFIMFIGDNEVIRDGTLKLAGRAQKVHDSIFCYLYEGMWHDWLLYSQNTATVKGPHAQNVLIEFCKTKKRDNKMQFSYQPHNYEVTTVNCNIVI